MQILKLFAEAIILSSPEVVRSCLIPAKFVRAWFKAETFFAALGS